jgi:murein DD-endopeptidase MepM/ murein hydrolase activator NlpD
MNDHFTVTIHDDNGVKQFNIHKMVKKAIIYAALFLGTIAIIAVGTIIYLNNSVKEIEKKKSVTFSVYDELRQKNKELQKSIKLSQLALESKKQELSEISDSLSEIEELIGLKPDENLSLEQRVNVTKLNSQQMMTLLQFIPSGSPIEYKGITSKFGYRTHPTLNRKEFHRGLDMKAEMKTPIYATADGIVEYAGYNKQSGYGRLIIIQHNYGFKTYFGHLNKISVRSSQFIKKGDLIGYTGNSGLSSGPHLHYEIRFISRPVNPSLFIKWSMTNYNEIFLKEKKIPWQSLVTATSHIRVVNPTQAPQLSPQDQKQKGK